MLKKNLVRTGFLGQSLLLLVPNPGSIKGHPADAAVAEYRHYKWLNGSRRSLDTMIIKSDSAGYTISRPLTEEEKSAAPKVTLNKHAMKFIKDFLKREKEALDQANRRGEKYFPMIDSIFSSYGLPLELRYLAIVESYLRTSAVSKAGAKGMWQFMPVTARELGLKVSKKYDERTHAYKSTVAAAKYLKGLYREFGDWLLVLAAYNGGPGTVYKAIKKCGSRNFWALQHYLPAESRGHVKRYIGTHYYFEGQGGVTTQTKAEAIAYKKRMDAYIASLSKKEHNADTVKIVAIHSVVE